MSAAVFYTATLGFALGILLQTIFLFSMATTVWLLLLSFALALWWRVGRSTTGASAALLLSVLLCAVSVGSLRFLYSEMNLSGSARAEQVGESVTLEGVVVREPDVRERTTQLTVRVGEELILVRADRYVGVSYGDRVTVTGELEIPTEFTTDLGRTFNYEGYLRAQGVIYLISFADVTVLARGEGNLLISGLLSVKQAFIGELEGVLPEPQVGLAQGLLLGVKRGLGEELEADFRATGIIHIVVLSGYNVALVITFVLYGLAFLLPLRARLVVGLIAITTFAILVGLSATVLRASVMAALLLAARFFGRTYVIVRALVVAGILMLMVNQHLLVFDVGFQLSFVATLGLIVLAPWLQARFESVPAWLGTREFLTATVAAQLFVTPLLLYQIGEFSVVSVLVNVLVLPAVPVAMLLTFLTGLSAFVFVPLATVVAYPTYLTLSYIIMVAERFAALPFASVAVPAFPFVVVVAAYSLLAVVGYYLYQVRSVTARVHEQTERSTLLPDVSGWTIVEEAEFKTELLQRAVRKGAERNVGEGQTRPSPTTELPIFFR